MKRFVLSLIVLLLLAGAGFTLWIEFGPPADVARTLIALGRSRAGQQLKEVRIPGFRIAYLDGGAGEPLLLIHGFGGDKDNWTGIASHLTPHVRVIALDLPGFGDSDKPPQASYGGTDQVARLRAFIETLGLRTVHLGGNSMGGRIALEYAARYPEQVKSLWLLAPAGVLGAEPSEMARRLARGEPIPLLARSDAEYEQLLDLVTERRPYLPRALRHALARRAAADYDLHRRIFEEVGKEIAARPLEHTAARVKAPTRIAWGRQDAVLHVSGAGILQRAMRDASVRLLDGIGHLPMIEAPQMVAEDYLAFRKIDTGAAVPGP